MANNDENKSSFPVGYERIEERLKQTKDLLEEIDRQINEGAPDKGPEPILQPSGAPSTLRKGNNVTRIAFLKDQQDRIKEDTWEKTEAETQNRNPRITRVVRDKVREELFPNRFRQMDKSERAQEKSKDNDLDTWQDIMDAEIVESAAKRISDPQPDIETPEREEVAPL